MKDGLRRPTELYKKASQHSDRIPCQVLIKIGRLPTCIQFPSIADLSGPLVFYLGQLSDSFGIKIAVNYTGETLVGLASPQKRFGR